jgi:cytochrome c-type biogenesis protein
MLCKIAGIIIFVFVLHYTGLIRIRFLMYEAHLDTQRIHATHTFGALLLGAAFAFGWTPCVGPILGAILAMAGAQNNILEGIALLGVYSLGLAVPFLLAAAATDRFIRWMQDFRHHLHAVEITSGILMMLVGGLIFLGSFTLISSWLIEHFPFLANIETTLTP